MAPPRPSRKIGMGDLNRLKLDIDVLVKFAMNQITQSDDDRVKRQWGSIMESVIYIFQSHQTSAQAATRTTNVAQDTTVQIHNVLNNHGVGVDSQDIDLNWESESSNPSSPCTS